jgi:hypothetical protein
VHIVWLLVRILLAGAFVAWVARAAWRSWRAARDWPKMLSAIAEAYGGTVSDVSLETDRERHSRTRVVCSFSHALDLTIGRRRSGSITRARTGVRSFDRDIVVTASEPWVHRATPKVRGALGVLMPEAMVANRRVSVMLDGRWSDVDVIASRIDAAKVLLSALDRRAPVELSDRFSSEPDPVFRTAVLLECGRDEVLALAPLAAADTDDLVRMVGTSLECGSIHAPTFHGVVRAQCRNLAGRRTEVVDRLSLACALSERLPADDLVEALEELRSVEELEGDAARALELAKAPARPTPRRVPRARDRALQVRAYAKEGRAHRRPVIEGLVRTLLEDPDPTVRRAAAVGLLELDAREVRDRMVPALDDPDEGNARAGDWPVAAVVRELFRRWDG